MRIIALLPSALLALAAFSCTGDDAVSTSRGVDGAATEDAEASRDAAPDAAAASDSGVTDGGDAHAFGDAGPIPVAPGDVVVLAGETLSAGADEKVSDWRNAIAPLDVVAKPVGVTGPSRVTVTLPSGELAACAAWSEGESPLSASTAGGFAIGSDDYSMTVVVQQGPAIGDARDNGRVVGSIVTPNLATGEFSGLAVMTEYQDAQRTGVSRAQKFAVRISYAGGTAVEVVEPTLSSPGMQVVAAYRRGDELRLRVGTTTYGPTYGASNVVVPASRPLILGSTRVDGDPDTRFAGRLCALILHRGPETDQEIGARVDALRARFVP